MTAIQICALIALIVLVGLTYWAGYRGGLIDGRIEGIDEGANIQRAESAKNIRELEASLRFIRADHQNLAQHCKKLQSNEALREEHHQTLLEIAEILRIAAETFSAFKTGKKLERDSLRLKDKAAAIAVNLKPPAQEEVA
ncbi:hypothetical protein [Pseudomonas sp. A-B-19]|uniref:hypothetical protein n=1 Tax=Pseudomonas sp. A-B-19 TaxID=2832405 RepID=UPI001CC04FF7|nr:hypothetical protein [Pseudomonas sp. A-B-19]